LLKPVGYGAPMITILQFALSFMVHTHRLPPYFCSVEHLA
jgi:hypothetical protein